MLMITAPVDSVIFRGWTILSFSMLYDFFTVTEKHFRSIGKVVNIVGRVLAMIVSVFFFLGLMGSDSITNINGHIFVATAGVAVDYNVLKWGFLLFPLLVVLEENLMIDRGKDKRELSENVELHHMAIVEQAATKEGNL